MFFALLTNKNELSDAKLIEKYKQTGNNWYIGVLYQRYTLPISAICYSYFKDKDESEDTVMEIFEIVMKDLLKYDVQNIKAWLLSVVKHYCQRKKEKLTRLQQKNLALKKNIDFFMEYEENTSPYSLDVSMEEYQKMENKLAQAINNLKNEQRICVELFYLHNKSYQDISNETGYSIKNVKSYIQNGKRNLKLYLESETNA